MKRGFVFLAFWVNVVLAQVPVPPTEPVVTEAALQQALANPALTQPQKLQLYAALINLYQQTKSYDQLAQTAGRYLTIDPSKSIVRLQQAQALAAIGKDAEAIAAVQEEMRRDALAQIKPSEAVLRILVRSHSRLKNKLAAQQNLIQLLTYYPQSPNTRAYWQDLLTQRIDALQNVEKPDKRVIYGFYRLLQATHNLTEADDIAEAAVLAMDAGQPHEALQILALNGKPDVTHLKIQERAERLAKADVVGGANKAPWEVEPVPLRWQELASLWRLLAK